MRVMFAATYPECTSALVLCGTFPTGVDDAEENPSGQRWVDMMHTVRRTGKSRTIERAAATALRGVTVPSSALRGLSG